MAKKTTALGAIEHAYRLIDNNFDNLYAKCTTAGQQQNLREAHQAARDAFWKAIRDGLKDNSDFVLALQKDLVTKTKEVQTLLQQLKNIKAALDAVAEMVRLAAALVTLAAP